MEGGAGATEMETPLQSMLNRRVYDKRFYQYLTGTEVKAVRVEEGGGSVIVDWEDGETFKFSGLWLRMFCHCPKCIIPDSGQPRADFQGLQGRLQVQSACLGEEVLLVSWREEEGHEGYLPLLFLKAHSHSRQAAQKRRQQTRMLFFDDTIIPEVTYDEVIGSDEGLYKWLHELNKRGICLIQNAPLEEDTLQKVAERISLPLGTAYGLMFSVRSKPRPINAAYNSGALRLHMDQPFYEGPPGLQLLHCIEFDKVVQGGDSTFLDLFDVAHKFRQEYPDEFAVLARVNACFIQCHYNRALPVHFAMHRPIFQLNKEGEIMAVSWNPHVTGPPACDEEEQQPFLEAYLKLSKFIDGYPKKYRLTLRPGHIITMNNRRVLHGREAFVPLGSRYLKGTYVQIDEFKSRYQVLANLLGHGQYARHVGNFDLI